MPLALLWAAIVLTVSFSMTRLTPDSSIVEIRMNCADTEAFILRETWSKTIDEACGGDVEWLVNEACIYYEHQCERTSL